MLECLVLLDEQETLVCDGVNGATIFDDEMLSNSDGHVVKGVDVRKDNFRGPDLLLGGKRSKEELMVTRVWKM